MNIRDDLRQLNTSPRELRKFGLLVGGVITLLGILLLLRHRWAWPLFLYAGVVLLLFGAVLPQVLKWVYLPWMSVAFILGFVMAHLILTLLFLIVLTPLGFVARWTGRDFLSLRLDPAAKSYWVTRQGRSSAPVNYERQF